MSVILTLRNKDVEWLLNCGTGEKSTWCHTIFGIPHCESLMMSDKDVKQLCMKNGIKHFFENGLSQKFVKSMANGWIRELSSQHKRHKDCDHLMMLLTWLKRGCC